LPEDEPQASVQTTYWNVDSSRRSAEHRCKRLRYLEYHSGPAGYGIRKKAQSLPLATGIRVHKLFAEVLSLAHEGVDRPVIRACITRNIIQYKELCNTRAFRDVPMPDMPAEAKFEISRVVDEQGSLLEGMAWGFLRAIVPTILSGYDVVAVEKEFAFLLQDGEQTVRVMTRPDILLRRKVDRALCIWDYKTGGSFNEGWKKQWENSPQLLLIKAGVEAELKEPCSFAYVLGVLKGGRYKDRADGVERQHSPFCYAYHREGNPPMIREDWQVNYDYTDADGKNHRLSKDYKRTPIWAFEFKDKPQDWTTLEYWVESLPLEDVQRQFEYLGPFDHHGWQLPSTLLGMIKQERLVREGLWAVYDVLGEGFLAEGEAPPEWSEADPRVLAALDEHFPQSWDCYKYGSRYRCQMFDVCTRNLQEPLQQGFEMRRPHHLGELVQMRERGIEPPPDQEGEEEAEE